MAVSNSGMPVQVRMSMLTVVTVYANYSYSVIPAIHYDKYPDVISENSNALFTT